MVKIREKQTEQLEKAASKGLKLGGWKKMTLSSKIAAVVLVLVALTAILAPLLAPYSPVEIFTARQAPGNGFIFGTDDKGRYILSRMLYGGRYSLIIGFGATAMALVCGSVVGALAAVSRKAVSETIMRILDIIMSIPGIALAAVFVSILGNSVPSIIFAIGTYINLAISDSSRFCIKKRKRFSFNSCCRAIERYCFSCVGTDVNLTSTASLSRCRLLILISNPFSTLAIANRILFFISRNCISRPVTIGLLSRAESNNFPLRSTISLYLLIPLFNDSSVSPSCSGNNRNSSYT